MLERLSSPTLPGTLTSAGKDALVINIFGGPGSGKSTLASRLFHDLKCAGLEVASPEEHAKLALWSGQPWLLDEQVVLLGRSWETLTTLRDKVDAIIVDSPILLCSIYADTREPSAFHRLAEDLHGRSDRINLFLSRNAEMAYSMNGRRETVDQALAVDRRIHERLSGLGETFLIADSQSFNSEILIDEIRRRSS